MSTLMKYGLVLFVLAAGCNSDLVTKSLAQESLKDKPSITLVSGFLDLNYTENRTASFGLFKEFDPSTRYPLLVGLQTIGSLVLIVFLVMWRKRTFWFLLPYLLVLAGAVGNLLSRIHHGYVIDFIHFHAHNRFHWPVFNLADILISVGMGLMILQLLSNKGKPTYSLSA